MTQVNRSPYSVVEACAMSLERSGEKDEVSLGSHWEPQIFSSLLTPGRADQAYLAPNPDCRRESRDWLKTPETLTGALAKPKKPISGRALQFWA